MRRLLRRGEKTIQLGTHLLHQIGDQADDTNNELECPPLRL
jgi:hypothetical protein